MKSNRLNALAIAMLVLGGGLSVPVLARATGAAGDTDFDAAGFRQLMPAGKLSFVLTVLESRDRSLHNFDYSVVETVTNRQNNEKGKIVAKCSY
jgi:hypothetical protein